MNTKLGIIGIVRNEMEADRRGTLQALAGLGYQGIETGYATLKQPEVFSAWRDDLEDAGMETVTLHLGREALRDELSQIIDVAAAVDCKYATVSWAPVDSTEQLSQDAALYNKAGEQLAAAGIRLCYHNHEHELSTRFGGRIALDILMGQTKPETLALHLDVAWAVYGGADPMALLERYANRTPLVHLKDLYHTGPRGCFTTVGTGVVPIKPCMQAAIEIGAAWVVVEQDSPRHLTGLDLATASILNLRELGWKTA